MRIKLRYTVRTDAENASFTRETDWPTVPTVCDLLDTHPMCGPHAVLSVSIDPMTGIIVCEVDDEEPHDMARIGAIDMEHAEYELWELEQAGGVTEGLAAREGVAGAERKPASQ